MGRRHKNRVQPNVSQSQPQRHGQQPSPWPTGPQPVLSNHLPHVSICGDDATNVIPIGADGDLDGKSGYDASRGNACVHGMRGKTMFPLDVAALIDAQTVQFLAELRPRTAIEGWMVSEMARATVQVDVGGRRLLLDEVRVIKKLDGHGWNDDAVDRALKLSARLHRQPYRTARALERTKQGAQLLIDHFRGLADAVETNQGLTSEQRTLLFDLVGVPLPLRDGTRRVPAANDGPALASLIAKELARLEALIVDVLDQRDREAQLFAVANPSTYNDSDRRNLRSDEARALKRLTWAKAAFDQLRGGTAPSSIVDPETHRPLDPEAHASPARSSAAPVAQPAPDEEPPPDPDRHLVPGEWPAEMREVMTVCTEALRRNKIVTPAMQEAAGAASAEPAPAADPGQLPPV